MPTRTRASSRSVPDRRVLAVRAVVSGGIGDELLTLPALRYLADVLERGTLEVLLGDHERRHGLFELLLGRPSVRVASLEVLEPAPCTWLLDLDSRWVPPPPAWLAGTSGSISVKTAGPGLHWRRAFAVAFSLTRRVGKEDRRAWTALSDEYRIASTPRLRLPLPEPLRRRLRLDRGRLRVAVSPGGHAPREKRWPLPNFARVVMGLREVGCDVLVLGDAGDAHLGRGLEKMTALGRRAASQGRLIDLTGRTRLEELPAILNAVDLHLACDNGVLHVGGAIDRPQVGLYLGGASRHVTPGRHDRRLFAGEGNGIGAITVERVARACGDLLENIRP